MLSIDLFTILWTVIDLIVLYLLMRRFLFKPVNAVLETRAKSVQEDLTQAQAQKAEAQELRKQYEEELKQARAQADSILEQAKAHGEELYQKRVSEAESRAKQMMEEASARNSRAKEQMLQDVRQEVVTLAMDAAAQIVRKNSEPSCEADIQAFLSGEGGPK